MIVVFHMQPIEQVAVCRFALLYDQFLVLQLSAPGARFVFRCCRHRQPPSPAIPWQRNYPVHARSSCRCGSVQDETLLGFAEAAGLAVERIEDLINRDQAEA